MKKILLTAIYLALVSTGARSAQQTNQPSQQKPAEQKSAAQKFAAQKSAEQAPATRPGERRADNMVRASQRVRTITGRVVDEGNQPIEGASITLVPANPLYMSRNKPASVRIDSSSTDEQGKFAIENVPPGAYMAYAFLSGYVIAPDADEEKREHKYYRPGDTVTIRMIKGGVITGTVTNSSGEPVVGVCVNPTLVRDSKNRPARQNYLSRQRECRTDDRGVYRMYGLEPGVYIISAPCKSMNQQNVNPYDLDVPTFFPSASRAAAAEVTVHSGQEVNGIDIRYRDNRGYMVSGTVTSVKAFTETSLAFVVLTDAFTGAYVESALASVAPGGRGFSITTVPDGEYIIKAMGSDNGGREIASSSPPRRVVVKGGDVAGVNLVVAHYGSIAGRVTLEPFVGAERKPECKGKRESSIEEVVIVTRLDEKSRPKEQQSLDNGFSFFPLLTGATPDGKGEFKFIMLEAARYYMEPKLPSEDWYIRSVTLPADPPATQPKDAALNGVVIKSGDNVTGMTVTIAEGAASLRGRIVPAAEGARLPDRLRIHLIPAENEAAENTLRFAEAAVQSDGAFALSNLPPGKYWLLTRPAADKAQTEGQPRPIAWDAEGRARLRKEGEAANTAIELQSCQHINDYLLRYKPAANLRAKSAESKQQ